MLTPPRRAVTLLALSMIALLGPAPARFAFGQSVDEPAGVATSGVRALAPNHASVTLRMIDAHGKIRPAGHLRKMEWVWTRQPGQDDQTAEGPALRLWIETDIPRTWLVRRVTGSATLAEPLTNPGSKTIEEPSPLTPEPPPTETIPSRGNQTLVIDVCARDSDLRLELTDEKGRPQELTVAILVAVSRPFVLVRPECGDLEVRMLLTKVESRNLFVGMNCARTSPGLIEVTFFRSQDSKWSHDPTAVNFDPDSRFVAFKYRFQPPTREFRLNVASDEAIPLFNSSVADDQGRVSRYSVFYRADEPESRFFGAVGLSPTYYKMDETGHGVHLSQYSANVRLSGGWVAIRDALEASVNLSGDVISGAHSPQNVPQVHFYALEPRLALRIPAEVEKVSLWVAGGWIAWGMDVPNDVFGVPPLQGPELYLEFRRYVRGAHGWTFWLKRATLARPLLFSSGTNYEEAIGATYELGPSQQKPFGLTTDFKHDHSFLPNLQNQIDGYSFSVGVMKRF